MSLDLEKLYQESNSTFSQLTLCDSVSVRAAKLDQNHTLPQSSLGLKKQFYDSLYLSIQTCIVKLLLLQNFDDITFTTPLPRTAPSSTPPPPQKKANENYFIQTMQEHSFSLFQWFIYFVSNSQDRFYLFVFVFYKIFLVGFPIFLTKTFLKKIQAHPST